MQENHTPTSKVTNVMKQTRKLYKLQTMNTFLMYIIMVHLQLKVLELAKEVFGCSLNILFEVLLSLSI